MEIEKMIHYKTQKLKLRADSTIEEVNKQLEFTEQINEFKASIYCYTGLADIFTQLNLALFHQKDLKKLNISFQQLHNITFEDIIYKLKDIQQLNTLILSFNQGVYFCKKQIQSMSSCLFQFPCLKTLEIKISTGFIDSEIELLEFYKNQVQLTSIRFEVSQVKEQSHIFHSLLRGLRFQKNLESFKLRAFSCKIGAYEILDLLEDELKESDNIQIIDLDFGQNVVITHYDFTKLRNLLKNFTKLEKLSFSVYSSLQEEEMKNTGFEDDLLKLTNLKELNLKFKRLISMNWTDVVRNISQMEYLQSVKLELSINSLSQIGDDTVSFGQSLAKIKHLEELNVFFSYNCMINVYEVIKFMIQLKSANNLKVLEIMTHCYEDSAEKSKYENLEYSDLMEVFNNLEKYSFNLSVNGKFSDKVLLNNIYSSFQNASKLKSLIVGFNGYQWDKIQKQQVNFDDLLRNQNSLQLIDINFQQFLLIEENHMINLFERLQYNPYLLSISFIFCQQNLSLSLQQLSKSIIFLKELKDLRITFGAKTELNSDGIISFADSLSNLKVLKTLKFESSKDQMSLNALNHLVSSFRNLKNLQDLKLRIKGDQFANDDDEKRFGDSFEFSTKLKRLDLAFEIKNLKYKNMKNLIKSISTEKQLQFLSIKAHFASDHGDCQDILNYFSQLKNLQNLTYLTYSMSILILSTLFNIIKPLKEITFDDDYKQFFLSSVEAKKKLIQNRKSIHSLSSQNENGQSEANDLIYNTSLKIVAAKLLNEETKENADEILPSIFENLSFLNEFHLFFQKNNNFEVDLSSQLFNNLSLLQNLSRLKIQIKMNNQIGSESLNELGISLTKLKLLKHLGLEIQFFGNNIELNECLSFFDDLKSLTELEQLDIRFHFDDGFCYAEYSDGEKEEIIGQLFESIETMINLKNLKLVIVGMILNKELLDQFYSLCTSLKSTLKTFYFFANYLINSSEVELLSLFRKSIKQLNQLSVLKTNYPFQVFLKQLKLVYYQRISYSLDDE